MSEDISDQSGNDPITNGARSDDIVVEICGWSDRNLRGESVPIVKLDSLLHADVDFVITLLHANDWTDADVLTSVRSYLISKRLNDTVTYVQARRSLTGHPLSPFYLGKKTFSLPPPTVTTISTEPVRNRSNALSRAKELISQYSLRVFDPAVDAHKYFEWKFDLVDVCNIEDSYAVKLEVLTNCLPSLMRLELLQDTSNSSSEDMFNSLLSRLDKIYGTIRATRHVESQFQQCRMMDGEPISSFYSRFRRSSRYYEKVANTHLSDEQLIVAFGTGLRDNKDVFLADLIETGLGAKTLSFDDYAQRLLYLSSRLPAPQVTEVNAIAPFDRSKRARTELGTPHRQNHSRGFGCYRCCEGNHSAITCPNKVKDFGKRCHRCGSRQHGAPQCKVNLTRDCRRCKGKHFESICPMDLPKNHTSTSNNAIQIDAPSPDIDPNDAKHRGFDELLKAVSNCSVELISVDCGLPNNHIDNNAIFLDVEVSHQDKCQTLRGLLDTGSGANFIHPDFVLSLAQQKIILPENLQRTEVTAKFGNESHGVCDTMITCDTSIDGVLLQTTFFVFKCSPKLIIGRSTLRQLGLLPQPRRSICTSGHQSTTIDVNRIEMSPNHVPDTSWIEEIPFHDKLKLRVRFPLLERVLVEPLREPLRPHSQVTESIILQRLLQMEKEDSAVQCRLEEIPVVVPVVLIDKSPGKSRTTTDPTLHSRYRITLDLRGYNRLELHVTDSEAFLIPRRLCTVGRKRKDLATQFQRSSFEILRKMPSHHTWFSKIDISNAYNRIMLPRTLQHVGTEVFDPTIGGYRYFRLTTLSQGWTWSPLFFRMAINFIITTLRDTTDSCIHADFYQDDVILSSADQGKLQVATTEAVKLLQQYCLVPRPDKVISCVREVTFCGYRLGRGIGGCVPDPKTPLTAMLKAQLWDDFVNNPAGRATWCKSFAGTIQYLYGFLGPQELEDLRVFYNPDTISETDLKAVHQPFSRLCDYVINGLPPMLLSRNTQTGKVTTVIICDANQDSWSSIVIKIIEDHEESPLPEWKQLFNALELDGGKIWPVRICGHSFSETLRRQSSTARERVAILLTLEECLALLEGTVAVINDNRNCQLEWHKVENLGRHLPLFTTFCEMVSKQVWMPRDSYPTIADYISRLISRFSVHVTSIAPSSVAKIIPNGSSESTQNVDVAASYVAKIDVLLQFKSGYQTTSEQYLNVSLSELYQSLINNTVGGPKMEALKKLFILDRDQILWYDDKIVVPENLRPTWLWSAHTPGGVHVGRDRTRINLSSYWWPTMSRDTYQFVQSCYICRTKKPRYLRKSHDSSTHSDIGNCHRAFESWHIDHCGPLGTDNADPTYILVCTCTVSKYTYSRCSTSCDAYHTAIELLSLFSIFGLPTTLHSDRGSAFTSELHLQLCRLLSIDVVHSPINFPRSNGIAERSVATIKNMISTFEKHTVQVRVLLANLVSNTLPNSTILGSTGIKVTPFEASFGFTPKTFTDLSVTGFYTNFVVHELQQVVRKASVLYAQEVTLIRDHQSLLKNPTITLNPGDMVIKTSPGKGMLKTTVEGPFILLNQLGSKIWRMFKLDDGLVATITECPTSLLQRYECIPEMRNLPGAPPIPNCEPADLKRNDMFIAKNNTSETSSPYSVMLYQVDINDTDSKKILAKIWRPNSLMQFFCTEKTSVIPWANVILGKVKLQQRMISQPVQQTIFTLLGGRL